jgi:very-short-patch-repair endonuclease
MRGSLKTHAREMRHLPTNAENALWLRLRGRQLGNAKFRRQQVLGPFVVDFYCLEHRLAIELDGGQHAEPAIAEYDGQRSQYLTSLGITILRFWNHEVLLRMDSVLEEIVRALPPHPDPLPEGEGTPAHHHTEG